jgi:predicted RNase H-like nuclease (RuvC/YqgF family)
LRASHRQPRREQPVKPEYLERENERLNRENEKLRQELIERDKTIAELERKLASGSKTPRRHRSRHLQTD